MCFSPSRLMSKLILSHIIFKAAARQWRNPVTLYKQRASVLSKSTNLLFIIDK